jgi:hypothetical protein
MGLDIYNMVKDVIGELPIELEFLYAIGTFLVLIIVFLIIYIPWYYIFKR